MTDLQEINVKLDVFEGPLDLLLHLIQKMKIDIYDIPITEVTAQYINFIHTMQTLELEVAGEYLVMAATLMAIKSKTLLPKQEIEPINIEEEMTEEDPRDQLVLQLLEYRKFKYAATVLQKKETERNLHYTKEPMDIEEYQENNLPLLSPNQLNTIDLFLAFHLLLEKRKKRKTVATTIVEETISIEEKIRFINEQLAIHGKTRGMAFECFCQTETKSEMIITFMALLELIKKGTIYAQQENNYDEIIIYSKQEE